jgi:L-ascorbate metabolism protein UlaG (beta-lactamase superfamily)
MKKYSRLILKSTSGLSKSLTYVVITAVLLFSGVALAKQVELLYLGHATIRITSTTGKVIVIDPFLTENPKTPQKYRDLKALGKVDLILVTHGHGDHSRDLGDLARLTGATVVTNWEYALQLGKIGVIDIDKAIAMNKGGTVAPLGRGIKVHMVPAEHSSAVDLFSLGLQNPDSDSPRFLVGGVPVGYVVELENGFKIYHSGDTDVFGDMALINKFHRPDLALVCIGGHFTMDPERAAYAVRELIKPKQVIPIHYGTYPVINRTPAEFKAALGDAPIKVLDVKPGQTVKF